jgi:hypothetical protein
LATGSTPNYRDLIVRLRAVQIQERDIRKQIAAGNAGNSGNFAIVVYADDGLYAIVSDGRKNMDVPVADVVDLRTQPGQATSALPVAPG